MTIFEKLLISIFIAVVPSLVYFLRARISRGTTFTSYFDKSEMLVMLAIFLFVFIFQLIL